MLNSCDRRMDFPQWGKEQLLKWHLHSILCSSFFLSRSGRDSLEPFGRIRAEMRRGELGEGGWTEKRKTLRFLVIIQYDVWVMVPEAINPFSLMASAQCPQTHLTTQPKTLDLHTWIFPYIKSCTQRISSESSHGTFATGAFTSCCGNPKWKYVYFKIYHLFKEEKLVYRPLVTWKPCIVN